MNESSEFSLSSFIGSAREKLPAIVDRILEITIGLDPIELLSHLALLHQTYPEGVSPDTEEMAQWQVKIEWLCSLLLARGLPDQRTLHLMGASVLGPLDEVLDEYLALSGLVAAAGREQGRSPNAACHELSAAITGDVAFVRGEWFPDQLQSMAAEIFSPHDIWCTEHLGLTFADATRCIEAVNEQLSVSIARFRATSHTLADKILANPALLRTLEGFPADIAEALLANKDRDALRDGVVLWQFGRSSEAMGFSLPDLLGTDAPISADVAKAYIGLVSIRPEDFQNQHPQLTDLTPLARKPLLSTRGRFHLLVPGRLLEATYYAFHEQLLASGAYHHIYDRTRSDWIESKAVQLLAKMLPGAEFGRQLSYGPKKARFELDGLLRYDNKLILIESKWKAPTSKTLLGNPTATEIDFRGAFLDPLDQAKRARQYIGSVPVAEFIETSSGRALTVRAPEISQYFILLVYGSGAWARVPAGLHRYLPGAGDEMADFPLAVSIPDLDLIAQCLQLPSQLFDYLNRREAIMRDGRFHVHDEWDFFGAYLQGQLDPRAPIFCDGDEITLDGFDLDLQAFLRGERGQQPPGRHIPDRLLQMLRKIDASDEPGRSDAICAVLAFPDEFLVEMDGALGKVIYSAERDGRTHTAKVRHPWQDHGVCIACGGEPEEIRHVADRAVDSAWARTGVRSWFTVMTDPTLSAATFSIRRI